MYLKIYSYAALSPELVTGSGGFVTMGSGSVTGGEVCGSVAEVIFSVGVSAWVVVSV